MDPQLTIVSFTPEELSQLSLCFQTVYTKPTPPAKSQERTLKFLPRYSERLRMTVASPLPISKILGEVIS